MESIYETLDFGYDPGTVEDIPIADPPALAPDEIPYTVDPIYLPPVGMQTTPSCFVWASTYCLATYAAAVAVHTPPTTTDRQASAAYTYPQVLLSVDGPRGTCTGGTIKSCFEWLSGNKGTPSLATAPDTDGCKATWRTYGNGGRTPDGAFIPPAWYKFSLLGTEGLEKMRMSILRGHPFAYGTRLYTDFVTYDGTTVPYTGNGQIAYKKGTNDPVGHVMVIFGYDDSMGPDGAVLIQNSFGTNWGGTFNATSSRGYVWMAYPTFQALAQGDGVYIGQPRDPVG
ncbi:MAG TPA: hypothetical protein VHY76_10400 [Acetobacteraceae bacterium]|nr:hypothetical protein [Acetobacteraceae bacterium]